MTTLRDLSRYRFEGKSEQAVREEWIFPLLLLLGYGPTTLNEVQFEESLKLRNPVRMLGSKQFKVDYFPTVLGRRLWLIEAKAPGKVDALEHLGQAWCYATHPEVNVPLMVLADGARLAVHDLTLANWDKPVLDIPAADLEAKFDDVLNLLGARTVARSMRRRVFDNLQFSLESELDLEALSESSSEITRIIRHARPQILENRRRFASAMDQERSAAGDEILRSAGLWGMAQEMNVPFGWSWGDVDRGLKALMIRPTEAELESLWLSVSDQDGNQRAAWGLRTFRLAIALQARSVDSCATAAIDRSRSTIRENLLGFPEDPIAAAAHRLEIPLFVFALRLVTAKDLSMRQRAQRHLEQLDAEAALLLGPGSRIHNWALSTSLLICRRFLAGTPWTLRDIDQRTAEIRRLLNILPHDENFTAQYVIGIDIGDNWEREDPLIGYILISLAKYGLDITLSPEERDVVKAFASHSSPGGDAARKLLS
jgi:hypothetical protein